MFPVAVAIGAGDLFHTKGSWKVLRYKTAAAGDSGLVASSWLSNPPFPLDTFRSLLSFWRCQGDAAPVSWSMTVYLWEGTDSQHPCIGLDAAGAVFCHLEATVRVGLGVGERLRPGCFVCAVKCYFTIVKCLLWWENAKNDQQNIFLHNCKWNKWWYLWIVNSHWDSRAQGSFKMCGLLLWLREQRVWCAGDAKGEVYGWRRFKNKFL